MNKLKIAILTIALVSSMPINADEFLSAQNADAATYNPAFYAGVSVIDEGGYGITALLNPKVAEVLRSHKTFCDIGTILAAATLLKYSWQLGEKIGNTLVGFVSKIKSKKS